MTTTPLTQEQLQRYIDMAKDIQTFRGYDVQMRKIQQEINYKQATASPEQKQEWQKQLTDLHQQRKDFPAYVQEKYGVENPRQMWQEMKKTAPAIEYAYAQQVQQPEPGRQQVIDQLAARQTVGNYLQEKSPDHMRPQEGRGEPYANQVQEAKRETLIKEAYGAVQEMQAVQAQRQSVGEQYAQQQLGGQARATQQASQTPTDQQLLKQVENFRNLISKQQQLQRVVKTGEIEMSPDGQTYLQQQQDATWNAWQNFIQQNHERLAQIPGRGVLQESPLLTKEQLVQMAREIDTAASQQEAREDKQDRKGQGIEHPETSQFMQKVERGIASVNEQQPPPEAPPQEEKGKKRPM